MKKLLSYFFPHIHCYKKPVVSQYVSFHTRNIIFECECGKREQRRVIKAFSEDFPIPTTPYISDKEMLEYLENRK